MVGFTNAIIDVLLKFLKVIYKNKNKNKSLKKFVSIFLVKLVGLELKLDTLDMAI